MTRYDHLDLDNTAVEEVDVGGLDPHAEEPPHIDGYQFERVLGVGGSSRVWRARTSDGRGVAIKLLSQRNPSNCRRLDREIGILQTLDSPAVVRYIDHGSTRRGHPYLAMEWLDGIELRDYLDERRLTVAEALTLGVRLASGLGAAHAHGIVHRDIKPANILLPGGDLTRATIIDFGVAHLADGDALTSVGGIVGTPAYMAPEQVRGTAVIAPSTDVYALGCVLFKCLAGESPFSAEHPVAALCKTLFEEVPRVSDLAPRVPSYVDDLLYRFLDKVPENRPNDGATAARLLADALAQISSGDAGLHNWHTLPADAITGDEQRLINIVIMAGAGTANHWPQHDRLCALAKQAGARVEVVRDGTLMAVLDSADVVVDQAAVAAQLALAWRREQPEARIGMATGRAVVGSQRLVGEVIDRAVALLGDDSVGDALEGDLSQSQPVRLDRLSAGLLGSRFDVHEVPVASPQVEAGPQAGATESSQNAETLAGAPADGIPRAIVDDPSASISRRIPLAAPHPVASEKSGANVLRGALAEHLQFAHGDNRAPFVGRERELALLRATLDECVERTTVRTVVLSGEAGLGKTRLFREFVAEVRIRRPEVAVWSASGDPVLQSPLSCLGGLLRSAVGILAGDTLAERKRKLEGYLCAYVPARAFARVGAFIGELLGTPIAPLDHVALRAARHDPLVMAEHIRRVCFEVLSSVLASRPVMVVIDDLHWVDMATLQLWDKLLGALANAPLMLIGLRRVGEHPQLDGLWVHPGTLAFELGRLSRRSSRILVQGMFAAGASAFERPGGGPGGGLGGISGARIEQLVEHARGNPFYLLELLHSELDAHEQLDGNRVPATALALVQARIDRLASPARRLLRAASVFGPAFWQGSVSALLGDREQAVHWLQHLCHEGLLAARESSRFSGENEYEFRHDLIREGAYAMLTEHDRQLAHRLAAFWLKERGEKNASVLARHFELGDRPGEAVGYYLQAAEDALEAGDLDVAARMSRRGIECGAHGQLLGMLHSVLVDIYRWRGDAADAAETCGKALELLPRGSRRWFEVAGESAAFWGRIDHWQRVDALAGYLLRGTSPGDDRIGWIIASAQVASHLIVGIGSEQGYRLLQLLDEQVGAIDLLPPLAAGNLYLARATRMLVREPGPAAMLDVLEKCAASFERAGDMRQACLHRSNVGYAKMAIGLYHEAVSDLRAALSIAEPMALERATCSARNNLGMALARCGDLAGGREQEERAIAWYERAGETRLLAGSRTYLARIHLMAGDRAAAEREARAAIAILPERASLKPHALALLAEARSANVVAALKHAVAAWKQLQVHGTVEEGEGDIRLTHARLLHAAGRKAEARTAIAEAGDRIVRLADTIVNPEWRDSFLKAIPEHAMTLELAERWRV